MWGVLSIRLRRACGDSIGGDISSVPSSDVNGIRNRLSSKLSSCRWSSGWRLPSGVRPTFIQLRRITGPCDCANGDLEAQKYHPWHTTGGSENRSCGRPVTFLHRLKTAPWSCCLGDASHARQSFAGLCRSEKWRQEDSGCRFRLPHWGRGPA